MAKKQFGKIAALAALAGAAAGITYFLRYKSFHEELEEDFHDFEDDLDEFDTKEEESKADREAPKRNYVSLTPEKACGDSAALRTEPNAPEAEGRGAASPEKKVPGAEGKGGPEESASSHADSGKTCSEMPGTAGEAEDAPEPRRTDCPEGSAVSGRENGQGFSSADGASSTTIVEDEDAAQ